MWQGEASPSGPFNGAQQHRLLPINVGALALLTGKRFVRSCCRLLADEYRSTAQFEQRQFTMRSRERPFVSAKTPPDSGDPDDYATKRQA
jgi:hypothetical protein